MSEDCLAFDAPAKFNLVSAMVECILYGLLVCIFTMSLLVAFRKHPETRVISDYRHIGVHAVGITMFLLATMHVCVDIYRVLDALLQTRPSLALIAINNISFLLKAVIFELQIILGDAFWLYRLHIVWKGDKRVTTPFFMLLLALIATAIYCIVVFAQSPTPSDLSKDPILAEKARQAGTLLLALTFVINVGCTVLLAARLYNVSRSNSSMRWGGRHTVLSKLAILIVESGAVYSILLLMNLVWYASGSHTSSIPRDAAIPVVGIVFYMLLLQSMVRRRAIHKSVYDSHLVPSRQEQPVSLRYMSNSQPDSNARVDSEDIAVPAEALNYHPTVIHVTKVTNWETS